MNSKKKKYYIYKMNLSILNIFSLLLLIIMALVGYLCYKDVIKDFLDSDINAGLLLLVFFLYMILHELIHSLFYVIGGAKFKNITYGMHLEKNILCCLCKQDISKTNILMSLLSPLIIIGIITFVIGLIFKLPLLYILSIINISGSIGDIIMFIFIVRLDKNINFSEFDDPTAFAIKSESSLDSMKPFGLTYINEVDKLEQNDYKKLSISKGSIIYIIGLIVLTLIMMIPTFWGV